MNEQLTGVALLVDNRLMSMEKVELDLSICITAMNDAELCFFMAALFEPREKWVELQSFSYRKRAEWPHTASAMCILAAAATQLDATDSSQTQHLLRLVAIALQYIELALTSPTRSSLIRRSHESVHHQ